MHRRAGFTYQIPATPAVLKPRLNGMESGGYDFRADKFDAEHVSAFNALSDLGFDLNAVPDVFEGDQKKPYQKLPTGTEVSVVTQILDGTGDSFPDADQRLIADYVGKARWFDRLAGPHSDLMERIIKDARVTGAHNLSQVFLDAPEFRARMVAWIFETLEKGDAGSQTTWREIGDALRSHFTSAELAPYRDVYLKIYQEQTFGIHLSDIMGKFGADPSAQFDAVFLPTKDGLERAMIAVCHADPQWRGAVSAKLLALFDATTHLTKGTWKPEPPFDRVGAVLAATGHYDALVQRYEAELWVSDRRLTGLKVLGTSEQTFEGAC